MPDLIGIGDCLDDRGGQTIMSVRKHRDSHGRRLRDRAASLSAFPRFGLHRERVLDHVADPFARGNAISLIIDIPVAPDDNELEVVIDAVCSRDGRSIVREGERNVRSDGRGVSVAQGGDEDDLLAGELLINLPQIAELLFESALPLRVRHDDHDRLSTKGSQVSRFISDAREREIGRGPDDNRTGICCKEANKE
jgi:hypothetical protein